MRLLRWLFWSPRREERVRMVLEVTAYKPGIKHWLGEFEFVFTGRPGGAVPTEGLLALCRWQILMRSTEPYAEFVANLNPLLQTETGR